MFIAMNRFQVVKGKEDAFEHMWESRDSYLDELTGFVEFHLLKGPEAEDHTLYSSHTVWASKADFEAWTKSEEFRIAHARAGNDSSAPLYLDHPKFEGFEVRQTLGATEGRLIMSQQRSRIWRARWPPIRARDREVAKEHGVTHARSGRGAARRDAALRARRAPSSRR